MAGALRFHVLSSYLKGGFGLDSQKSQLSLSLYKYSNALFNITMQKKFHKSFRAQIKFVQVEYKESCFRSSSENSVNECGRCIVTNCSEQSLKGW